MVLSVVMYGCESWTIKKAERQRSDAFELWCWRRLRVPWTARKSNQWILKEIGSDYSLERLRLTLKLQSFGHLMWRTDSPTHWKRPWCWERLKAGGEGNDTGWDGWMASPTRWTWVWASSGSWSTGFGHLCTQPGPTLGIQFKSVVLSRRQTGPREDIQQRIETFASPRCRGGAVPASGGCKPGTPLNILRCSEQPRN